MSLTDILADPAQRQFFLAGAGATAGFAVSLSRMVRGAPTVVGDVLSSATTGEPMQSKGSPKTKYVAGGTVGLVGIESAVRNENPALDNYVAESALTVGSTAAGYAVGYCAPQILLYGAISLFSGKNNS